jgi:hypothetical protein
LYSAPAATGSRIFSNYPVKNERRKQTKTVFSSYLTASRLALAVWTAAVLFFPLSAAVGDGPVGYVFVGLAQMQRPSVGFPIMNGVCQFQL